MLRLLVLLLPLTLFAQIEFEPVRLDNGLSAHYWYPTILSEPDGNLLCTWSAWTGNNEYSVFGQRITPTGELIGNSYIYETADCAARPTFIHLPDGHRAELFYHG